MKLYQWIWILFPVFLLAGNLQAQSLKNMSDLNQLKHHLELIDQGKILEWKGLGKEWNGANLEKLFSGKIKYGGSTLGKAVRSMEIQLPHQPHYLRCYLNKQDEVIFVKMDDAKLSDNWAKLTKLLGKAEKTTSLVYNHSYAPCTQFVYAQKGITMYVMDLTPIEKSVIGSIALYSPATVEAYINDLGGNSTTTYSPFRD